MILGLRYSVCVMLPAVGIMANRAGLHIEATMIDVGETRPLAASVEFHSRPLIEPLVLSSGRIDDVVEVRVAVRVRVGSGAYAREAVGRGAIYLSDLWAWPDATVPHHEREGRMQRLCERIAAQLPTLCGGVPAHPLELGLQLHKNVGQRGEPVVVAGAMPALARLVCLSPFDAALHDAVGQALQRSAFALYDRDLPIPSADAWVVGGRACRAIRTLMSWPPRRDFPACFVIGPDEELEPALDHWVKRRRYERVKLKLKGREPAADVARTVEVTRKLLDAGVAKPWISVDTNEASGDAATVGVYLSELERVDRRAYDAVQYLEQPTSRDLDGAPQDWHAVATRKPILLDEGLTSLDDLAEARRQGWSGCALKTCKGHSFSLVTAAWAAEQQWLVALQDLTNPGWAAVHAALFAAHVPTWNGLELNSPQFTPQANADWLPRLRLLLEPLDGLHHVDFAEAAGLGSTV